MADGRCQDVHSERVLTTNITTAEAEVREILEAAVKPASRLRMGEALAELGRRIGLSDADIEAIEGVRSTASAEPMKFG